MTHTIHFMLNDQEVTASAPPGLLVLDYLRWHKRLVATKEGCREGDCGACTVLIGSPQGEQVTYKPVTSCLMPLGELQGKHLVTLEGLNLDALSPIQQAIVDEGATQCGFCTPGIVVSLTGELMRQGGALDAEGVDVALSGHLCRCTGYGSLRRAGETFISDLAEAFSDEPAPTSPIDVLIEKEVIPAYFRDVPTRLAALPQDPVTADTAPNDVFIAGGTDLYVQHPAGFIHTRVEALNRFPEMGGVSRQNGQIRVGALTTFEDFAQDPIIQQAIPEIQQYMFLIASLQIRNRATLGGNLVNASPIGDMTILLLALSADVVLVDDDTQRTIPLKHFYKGYKQLDKTPKELLTEIVFPAPTATTRVHFEKVSKRKCLDIATVNSALYLNYVDDVMQDVTLTMGGVAPVPLWMQETSAFLTGKPPSNETLETAFHISQQEVAPISDVRGSAPYKRLLVRQLLTAHFATLFPGRIETEALLVPQS